MPTSGNKLVIVGIDDNDLLHIRIFDAGGKGVMDTDETKLSSAQVVAIATLKRQLPDLLAPHELTGGKKARVIRKVISIVGQASQDATATAKPSPTPRHSPEVADHSIEIGPGRGLISESRPLCRTRRRMMRPTHPCSSTAATIRGNPFSQGTHTIMTRFLTCICVLVGRRPDRRGRVRIPPHPNRSTGRPSRSPATRTEHTRRMRFLRIGNRNG